MSERDFGPRRSETVQIGKMPGGGFGFNKQRRDLAPRTVSKPQDSGQARETVVSPGLSRSASALLERVQVREGNQNATSYFEEQAKLAAIAEGRSKAGMFGRSKKIFDSLKAALGEFNLRRVNSHKGVGKYSQQR